MPSTHLGRDDLTAIIEAAVLAPSADNCQPWRFRWDGQQLHVELVPERGDLSIDVRQAGAWIALGAAIANMRLTAGARGFRVDVSVEAGVGASLRFTATESSADPLASVLARRCTNRRAYTEEALPSAVRAELLAAVERIHGVRLDLIEDRSAVRLLAALAAQFDQILFEDRRFHDALYHWVRWTPEEAHQTQDGLPIASLELHPIERSGFHLLASWRMARLSRALGLTRVLPRRSFAVYRRSAALGLVTTEGASPDELLRGGEAFERLWLTVSLRNLALQPLGGLTFLVLRCRLLDGSGLSPTHRALAERIRTQLRTVLPAPEVRMPIMFFRLGHAKPPTARSLRRRVEDVLTIAECGSGIAKP